MGENLTIALQITALGMGLVFGAILLLWGTMALLMRVTAEREPATPDTEPAPAGAPAIPAPDGARRRKQRAAAVAVATALALQVARREPAAAPPTATVSAWQAVMRGRQLKERGPVR